MVIKSKHLFWCFCFWSFVVLLDFANNFFQGIIREVQVEWYEVIPFATSWYLWFFLSFPVMFFVNTHRYSGISTRRFALYHLGFYLFINTVQVLLSSVYIRVMLEWLNDETYSNLLGKTAVSGSFYNFIIYATFIAVINGVKYYQDLQREKTRSVTLQKQLTDSRLSFLKQQLHPHFLFNAHHSIITLMKLGEKQKSIRMMEKLSDLMRFYLKENSAEEMTLKDELSLLKLYVDIQNVRFDEKLKVAFETDQTLDNVLVPSMILQPLVENAIKYSVERCSTPSWIIIGAGKTNHQLVLWVKDRNSEKPLPMTITKGIGLTNISERLATMYGNQQQFNIAFFEDKQCRGLDVTLKIPLKRV